MKFMIVFKTKIYLTAALLILVSQSSLAQINKPSGIELCLKENLLTNEACLKKETGHVTIAGCYEQVNKIKSVYLKEKFKNYCFYGISEFPSLETCTEKALLFFEDSNVDNGLFECVSQNEATLKAKSCFDIAKKFKLKTKQTYLEEHCNNLEN